VWLLGERLGRKCLLIGNKRSFSFEEVLLSSLSLLSIVPARTERESAMAFVFELKADVDVFVYGWLKDPRHFFD